MKRITVRKEVREEAVVRRCPRCNDFYTTYPATSRRDNSTQICSQCGTEEAMVDWTGIAKAPYRIFQRELKFCKFLNLDIKETFTQE